MSIKRFIKNALTGISIPREYCCLDLNSFHHGLSVFASTHEFRFDITSSHIFLGYKPLLIALSVSKDSRAYEALVRSEKVNLEFEFNQAAPQFTDAKINKTVATLDLNKLTSWSFGQRVLFIYNGIHGDHSFLSPWHKFVNRQREKIQERNPGNVGLPANLLDQVQIAYAVPRKISIVTVGKDPRFNMFPTDLHGEISHTKYVSSLRIGGKATHQVEEVKNIVISDVDVSSFKDTYDMGKNHMKDFQEVMAFDVSAARSEKLDLILPKSVTGYREMTLSDSWDYGIHRIHFYDVVNVVNPPIGTSGLGHIHRLYAGWREKSGLQTELYFY